ncbi:MAG TPA: protein kinase [Bryobacteraceae bacterium]|nr:protein kinase [Bryobacteraceae bacterium]
MSRSTQPTVTMKPARAAALWLPSGLIVQDAIRGREYRVEKFLGQGGFGAAYQAHRLSGEGSAPRLCVLKVTIDAATWHSEAYFGHLLRHVPALVEVYDSFAWAPRGGRKPLYCLISEYMPEGDLNNYLARNPEPWRESRARREILHLLRAVTMIHESGAVHRDITPRNVFVASNGALKLGDFGIAVHRLGRREVRADAFAPRFAPRAIQEGAKHWRQADDVHQIGQLYAALLSGVGSRKITAKEVKALACSPHTKSVLQRCIGQRRKCFTSAAEMLAALETWRQAVRKPARVRSLTGKRVVFTGGLSMRRAAAQKLARKAGAIVEARVNHLTDIVVVGDQSPHWKAEEKGQKLLDVDREAERGHNIALVKESRFLTLVGPKR